MTTAAPKLLRRFKQVFEGEVAYLAKEICYLELESGLIKQVCLLKDGSTYEGPVTDEKSYKLNMEGFDIISKRKDGSEFRARVTGMLEDKAFEEIKTEEHKVIPVGVTVTVEGQQEEISEKKSA